MPDLVKQGYLTYRRIKCQKQYDVKIKKEQFTPVYAGEFGFKEFILKQGPAFSPLYSYFKNGGLNSEKECQEYLEKQELLNLEKFTKRNGRDDKNLDKIKTQKVIPVDDIEDYVETQQMIATLKDKLKQRPLKRDEMVKFRIVNMSPV